MSLFTTLLLVCLSAIIGGLIAKAFRQPLILGYIAVGVAIGNVFGQFVDRTLIDHIAEGGVTLLLFTLGIEFSFQRLRSVLRTVSWAAVLQMLISFAVFMTVFLWMGYAFLPALYIALASSLSSTAVVIRILSERGELETIPGEVLTGWLIVQDLAVIPIMLLLPALTRTYLGGSTSIVSAFSLILVNMIKAAIAIGGIVFLGKRGIPWILNKSAKLGSREVFLLIVIAIVFLSASIAYAVGLSTALGAFIAGLLVAETSQNHSIFAEIRPLRDIFAVIFFVSLGMGLPVSLLVPLLPMLFAATLVLLLVKPAVVYMLSRFLGYHRKTSFLVAMGLIPLSEFGCIIARQGWQMGALSEQQYVFLISLVFLTIMMSSSFISRSQIWYYAFHRSLSKKFPKIFPDKKEESLFRDDLPLRGHVVICGYGRVGKYIGRALEMADIPFIVVDYNQTTVSELKKKGIPVIYGDPADLDVLDFAQVDFAKMVVIAIPDRHTQEMVIANALTLNKTIHILCRTHHEEDQLRLKTLGVATIVQLEFEAAISITNKLLSSFGISNEDIEKKIQRLKIEHGMA